MAELSIIIPFVNEWPQALFTIRNIAEELRDRVDFEILAIDNWCEEVERQGQKRQKDGEMVKSMSSYWPWLKYLHYDERLSHWQCKNFGVKNSTGKFLCFIDAHCVVQRDALYKAFDLYQVSYKALEGTLHLPLTYHILEKHKLIYALVYKAESNDLHYRFSSYRDENHDRPYEVPVMSTCGMIMTRELYDLVGGWPEELGIYGGGENYMNFVLAVLGKKKWIMPGGALCHHGARRGYHWYGDDYLRNRLIANYCFGGFDWAEKWWSNVRGRPDVLKRIWNEVLRSCKDRRQDIKVKQKITIEEWLRQWI